jgi:hypothetical protein
MSPPQRPPETNLIQAPPETNPIQTTPETTPMECLLPQPQPSAHFDGAPDYRQPNLYESDETPRRVRLPQDVEYGRHIMRYYPTREEDPLQ